MFWQFSCLLICQVKALSPASMRVDKFNFLDTLVPEGYTHKVYKIIDFLSKATVKYTTYDRALFSRRDSNKSRKQ